MRATGSRSTRADAVAAMCAEGLVYDEPAIGPTVHGRDAIRRFVAGMAASYPDYVFTLEGAYTELGRPAVLVAWRVTGTRADNGRAIDFHGDDRLEIGPDGLITRYRCLYDHHLVLAQIAT